MYNSQSFNALSSLCNTNRTSNLIEFNNIYENIKQQQRLQQLQQQYCISIPHSNVASSTCSSVASSLSASSTVSKLHVQRPPISSDLLICLDSSKSTSRKVDHRKLFVGNLPANTKLSEILEFFKKYGSINEKLSVVKDQNYAFVHFHSEDDAKIALREANDSLFKNRYIRVQFSTSQAHVKKSSTFDATIGLIREPVKQEQQQEQPKQAMVRQFQSLNGQSNVLRPITGGNKRCNQQMMYPSLCPSSTNTQAYYSPFQQYQLFEIDSLMSTSSTSQMVKSNTFATFPY